MHTQDDSRSRTNKGTLSSQAIDSLIFLIKREGYTKGVLLPSERELCMRFGVSRTVIREALQVLAARGIVTIRRGVGVTVGSAAQQPVLDYFDLLLRQEGATVGELLELRRVLEVGVTGLAAQRATLEDIAAMEQSLQVMHARPDSPDGYVDADVEFHRLIVQGAHNRLFVTVLQPIGSLLRASRIASFRGRVAVERAINDHEVILEGIRSGSAEAARAAMYVHLQHTEQNIEISFNQG